ncbi:MAG: chaperone modulator CbpM [Ectothiorhodospiraceae bacterium]|jgi:chaperone modulatory protein CbpM
MKGKITSIDVVVLDRSVTLTLGELCRVCDVDAELLIEMVEEGVVEPEGRTPEEWRFRGESVRRVQTALRLAADLRLNLPGAALAVDLIEELEALRGRLLRYEPESGGYR